MRRVSRLLGSNGGQAVMSSGVVVLLTVLTGVLSARLLHVEQRGVTAAVLALAAMFAQAGNAGPAETQLLAPQRGHPMGITIRITWLFSLGIVLLSAVPVLAYLFRLLDQPAWSLVVIVATTPAIAGIGILCNYLLIGSKKFSASALLRTMPVVLQIIILVGVWLSGTASVLSVIAASWSAGLLAVIIGLIVAKPWQFKGGSLKEDSSDIIKMIFNLGVSHSIRIIGYRIDLIILGFIAGGYAAGIYSVATSLTAAGITLTANLTPLVATRKVGDDSARFTQVSSLFALTVAIGIILLGPLFIPLVYGGKYSPSWMLIVALAVSMYGSFVLDSAGRIFQRAGHEKISLRVSVLVIVVQILGISIGALALGAVGAAIGNLLAYVIGIAALIRIASKLTGLRHLPGELSPLAGMRVLYDRLLK